MKTDAYESMVVGVIFADLMSWLPVLTVTYGVVLGAVELAIEGA